MIPDLRFKATNFETADPPALRKIDNLLDRGSTANAGNLQSEIYILQLNEPVVATSHC